MGWKPFCIGLLCGLFGAMLAVGLYSCGAVVTPTIAPTATPARTSTPTPPTVTRVMQAFRDAGLPVYVDPSNLTAACIRQPGLIEAQGFGSQTGGVGYTLASFATIDQAEQARSACVNRLNNGFRQGPIVFVTAASDTQGYLPYFAVLQALR